MIKTAKYIFIIFLLIILVSGGVYFYLKKDGYQINFNSNGGSIVSSIQTDFRGIAKKPDDPVRVGYQFDGWYCGDEKFDFDTKIDENVTLTAHWREEEETLYTLSFDSLGGSAIEEVLVKEGEVLMDIPTPIKDGYEFQGWYYHNKEFDFSSTITKDMVLVAKYEKLEESKNLVVVTFDSNGGSFIDEVTTTAGSLIKMPKEPVREGYQFDGWYLEDKEFDFTNPVYEDTILDAYWVKE